MSIVFETVELKTHNALQKSYRKHTQGHMLSYDSNICELTLLTCVKFVNLISHTPT
uniref:Uncharacterized protein n=1 Tax=Rhizophora mucronata TaxID=61149 RepID=A0A2P2NU13_RHIMU